MEMRNEARNVPRSWHVNESILSIDLYFLEIMQYMDKYTSLIPV